MEKFQERILELIRAGGPVTDEEFDRLSALTYERQRALCPIYDRYCGRVGAARVRTWRDIPALPVTAFKHHRVACFTSGRAKAAFLTSGTTRGKKRGRHEFEDLRFYDAAIRSLFKAYVLPDLRPPARIDMVFLVASGRVNPESSLSHMGDRVLKEFGERRPLRALAGHGLDLERSTRRLKAAAASGRPVLVFTTTFALADLLDRLGAQGVRIALPRGSRIMETGGYKGRRTQVARPELVRLAGALLGVPATHIINEYGMTELSSQFYDRSLRTGAAGDIKEVPPWVRVTLIDPISRSKPAQSSKPGLIRIYDLANQGSCMAVQTEDLGLMRAGGFEVLGRAAGSGARGCSLDFEGLSA
jgi:hypothetical protein